MTFPVQNITKFADWGTYNQTVTDGLFGPVVLFVILIASSLGFTNLTGGSASFVAGSTLTMIIAILFRGMDWVGDGMMFLYIAIFIISLVVAMMDREK